ncbi:MAG TPA: hypothetical protein VMB35_02715 [Methanomicrobiales archaeon]|nr:hypothetical protein [Methanomicrobiales archaeon]
MTAGMKFNALAGQSAIWITAKAAVSLSVVGLAGLVSRGGLALAVIIVFMGVTGPTIRLVTMKMGGIYDRILVSPASKPGFFLEFAGYWAVAVLLPLVPAIVAVAILAGPAMIIPVLAGTVLAVTSGTMAGFMSRGLSDAHLAALLVAGLLIALSLVRTPVAGLLPYSVLAAATPPPAALAISAILPVASIALLCVAVSRS